MVFGQVNGGKRKGELSRHFRFVYEGSMMMGIMESGVKIRAELYQIVRILGERGKILMKAAIMHTKLAFRLTATRPGTVSCRNENATYPKKLSRTSKD